MCCLLVFVYVLVIVHVFVLLMCLLMCSFSFSCLVASLFCFLCSWLDLCLDLFHFCVGMLCFLFVFVSVSVLVFVFAFVLVPVFAFAPVFGLSVFVLVLVFAFVSVFGLCVLCPCLRFCFCLRCVFVFIRLLRNDVHPQAHGKIGHSMAAPGCMLVPVWVAIGRHSLSSLVIPCHERSHPFAACEASFPRVASSFSSSSSSKPYS